MKKFTKDHRTRVTRMLLRKAFTSLLEKKPISSITIKELCELAGVNRGTFYAHYTDLYDLLSQIEEEMTEDFAQALELHFPKDGSQPTPLALTTGVFECLKENSDLCIVTLGDYGDKNFALRLLNLGREKTLSYYAEYFQGASPKKLEFFYAFISSGCIGLLQKWLSEGMLTPAGEMASMAQQIILSGVGFLQNSSAESPQSAKL